MKPMYSRTLAQCLIVTAALLALGPLGFSLRIGPVFDRVTIPVAGVVPTYDGEIQIRQNGTS